MTEEDARRWLHSHLDVPRETFARLEGFIALLKAEMPRQNLIAESTVAHLWARHIVDSAQLLPLAGRREGRWADLGSGAGFPGLVIALLAPGMTVDLIESRRKRIDFLGRAVESLGLGDRVTVRGQRVESLGEVKFDIISARAFAPLARLLDIATRLARPETVWLLPKGRSAASELEAAQSSWQGAFRLEPSITDPGAAIIVASNVKPKGRR